MPSSVMLLQPGTGEDLLTDQGASLLLGRLGVLVDMCTELHPAVMAFQRILVGGSRSKIRILLLLYTYNLILLV